eukprot:TRINITY_DN323_c0_g4_i1.p1 TRINITY_DN323_c0_g4~~TRINITY_DN323_c0_g4_i1.p1  ORF type:complete len:573 (-),score=178.12 TRINITY_DN323_c0_g4_i1:9-1727(-)
MAHRGDYKRKDAGGLTRKRVTASIRKEKRAALLAAKRHKGEVGQEDGECEYSDGGAPLEHTALTACVEALSSVASPHSALSEEQASALEQLRSWLCRPNPPVAQILEAGAAEPIVGLVQHTDRAVYLSAAWCVTNIASSADPAHSNAVLATLPALVSRCATDDVEVADQCVWAIGNIAACNLEARDAAVSCGAIPMLTDLIGSIVGNDRLSLATCCVCPLTVVDADGEQTYNAPPDTVMSLADYQSKQAETPLGKLISTALWALSNMARGDMMGREFAAHHGKFFANGIADVLPLLLLHPEQAVAVEAAWLMAYLSKPGVEAVSQLFARETESVMVENGPRIAFDGPMAMSSSLSALVLIGMLYDPNNAAIAIPALRVLGNVITAGRSYAEELLRDVRLLRYLAHMVRRSIFIPVRKEAAFVISNIAVPFPGALVENGVLNILINLLSNCNFVVQKEVCYALLNIAMDLKYLSRVVEAGVLSVFISLLRTADVEAQRMALDFIELVLRKHPHGCQMVQNLDGIDAMEQLQLHDNPQVYKRVDEIMERYFSDVPADDLEGRQEPVEYPPWRRG